jgi:hypothetical protein
MRWARDYIASPHPDLGRKGAICPFVQKSIQLDRLLVVVHDEVDGSSLSALREIILTESERFAARHPPLDPVASTAGLILAFPRLTPERCPLLDTLQNELKTHMMQRDMMLAAFHAGSTKPAQHNAAFALYRSPVPTMVLRALDVRDIVFLRNNRDGFLRFRARFGDQFVRGLVSDEHGHVTMYEQALERWS